MICSVFVVTNSTAQQITDYPIIPYPSYLKPGKGSFIINEHTQINADNIFEREVSFLKELLRNASGYSIKETKLQAKGTINLQQDNNLSNEEGYYLSIKPETILITAKTNTGIYRALQTIRQLLPYNVETNNTTKKAISLPTLEIQDEPVYHWRGMHLDVSRHFFSIDYLKKFMDVMALYKMNKLHLHLTDDQGWRIEIKKYPKLTEEGAWRTFNNQDSACMKLAKENPDMAIDTMHIIHKNGKTLYGGFYKQEQIKELVAYATSRHIDIIPEIDMPGHMMAAIYAYPNLSCEGGSQWGALFSTPICPCKESTFAFAEDVFNEIFELFPSEYVHLGADEVDRKTWMNAQACKELMEKEGLKSPEDLQSYFVKRMEKFFHSKGKKLIGWDEILEGGVSKTAYVMYWQSWVPEAPVKAAKSGNYVIMTPGNPLYFDYPPDIHSLKNIYSFNVVPAALNANEAKFIMGAQANIWTEYIPSEKRADFMYMPRMTALAERLWSKQLDYTSYRGRLIKHYPRLDALKINYRQPDLTGFTQQNVFTDKAILQVQKELPTLNVRYTLDGSIPAATSPVLPGRYTITKPLTIKMAAFNEQGVRGEIYTIQYRKETFAKPVVVQTNKEGLKTSYYKKYFKSATLLDGQDPDSIFVSKDFIVPSSITAPSFGLQYEGYIQIPETGIYSFYLTCDDGGILYIGDKEVVNNDGLHSAIQKTGQVALQKGQYPLRLAFIEGGGGFKLELKYGKGNTEAQDIPGRWLRN
ncbi:family 20 glycosylhydrolase [Chitinophagaceae bacterium LB-8]|uniref:beta-N-acetylhexosaminidase n=1 Tax=Paraflavisolibacter caeni TaxID=2982496 RepID=A0A9X2XZ23_9BACT|nr:family 20 glycosylhydrolase [Paraflavisolibacter caeni]MCU7551835.1 family 20 glycosylhydrolase [Paraflavisolibacter caeni]